MFDELEAGLLARLVHGRERRAGQPGCVVFDPEEGDALARAGGDHDQVGHVPVEDEHLVPVEDPAIPARLGRQLDPAEVPPSVVLCDGQGPDGLARGQTREEVFLGLVVARRQHRVGGQGDGGEERRAQQRRPHLLEHHDQLHVGEARTTELLGDRQRLEAELVGHLAPHRGVVALGRLHEAPHLGLG